MSKENMNLGESFQAKAITAAEVGAVKPRHRIVGWGLVAAILGILYYLLMGHTTATVPTIQERPGLTETLGQKFGGKLYLDIFRAQTGRPRSVLDFIGDILTPVKPAHERIGPIPNLIVNAGETALRDCFIATSCATAQNLKFHGLGTSAVAVAEGDTGCTTELTTQYNPDGTRATGTQTNNGANIYRTVGSNTVDAAVTIAEFCLMNQATTGGTMWTHILTGSIALSNGDTLQTTYDLTIE